MQRIRSPISGLKALLVFAGVLLVLFGTISIVELLRRSPTPVEQPGRVQSAAKPPQVLLDKGRYLATVGNCATCHTRQGGSNFAGGLAFYTPLGKVFSTNITPDLDTGIGGWTEEQFRRALRAGIAADGHNLFPAFPYPSFTRVTDDDIKAIYAYLMSMQPVRYIPPRNGILFTQRWVMRVWNALFLEPGPAPNDINRSAAWNRGAYLVRGLAHCGACHTPRNRFLVEQSQAELAGGTLQAEVDTGQQRRWSAVNLTPGTTGLASWSSQDISGYLKKGYSRRGGAFGPMNEVIAHSTQFLNAEDLDAIATFIKGLGPVETTASTDSATAQTADGEPIYKARCEKCHGSSGRGGMFGGPPLQGSAVALSDDPASLINVILYGAQTPKELPDFGAWEVMQPYKDVLSDSEVTAVANYVRNNWKNHARIIAPREVAAQR